MRLTSDNVQRQPTRESLIINMLLGHAKANHLPHEGTGDRNAQVIMKIDRDYIEVCQYIAANADLHQRLSYHEYLTFRLQGKSVIGYYPGIDK